MSPSFAHVENYTLVKTWGSFGTGNGHFDEPSGIAVDSSGYVYVADAINVRIEKFDSNGKFIAKEVSFENAKGQFGSLIYIAINSSGNVNQS